MSATKQQINQRILFDEYLKECYKNFIETKEEGSSTEFKQSLFDTEEAYKTGSRFMWFLIDKKTGRICQTKIMEYFEVGVDFEKPVISSTRVYNPPDYGKKFFDWAKQRAEELRMPKSTFKTIKDTRVRATQMLQEWWGQFATTQEIFDWLEENDIMLK
jgi:hypothetical protein